MAYVLKVEYERELRRVLAGEGNLSFAQVEGRIRDVFRFPSTSELKLTYQDTDGDVITMANDSDLTDACIIQELNPLRLQVALLPNTAPSSAVEDKDVESNVEQNLAGTVEELVGLFEPMLRKFFSAEKIPAVLTNIVERVRDNIDASSGSTKPSDPSVDVSTRKPEQKLEIHETVTCDVCEMKPIVGPRYKSMKKFNYDLCSGCYEREGNAFEYRRIHPPLPHPASSNVGAVRLMQIRNMTPGNVMWRGGRGMSHPFAFGHRGGRCRMDC